MSAPRIATALVRFAIRAFPRRFRDQYAAEIEETFRTLYRDARDARGVLAAWIVTVGACRSLIASGLAERIASSTTRNTIALLHPDLGSPARPEDSPVNALLADLRYGFRALRRRPTYALVAVMTLGLGIGASTAMFSLAHGVVFQPLPWPEPDRLVRIYDTHAERGWRSNPSTPGNFADWRDQQRTFAALASFNTGDITYTGAEPAQSFAATEVSSEWTDVLRVRPALGRAFTRDEETFGNHRVVILSHGLWRRLFGGDSAIVGRTIALEGNPYTVVGVMPADFAFPAPSTQLWVPLAYDFDVAASRGAHYIEVIGRLAPGVTHAAANADLNSIMDRLREIYPEPLEGWGVRLVSLHEATVGNVRERMLIFLGAVALVLLVACVNVANLSMAHAVTRLPDLAVRAAMGGGAWRIARQLAFEGLVMATAAGLVGLIVAALTLRAVVAVAPASIPRLDAVSIDAPVLVFATVLSLAVGMLVGAIPALRAARRDLYLALREGARATSGPRATRLRHAFVVAQISLAVVLAVGSGLLVRSFSHLARVDPGFRAEGVLVGTVSVPSSRYPDAAERGRFFLQLLERLERVPGVTSAAVSTQLPLEGYSISFVYWVDGSAAALSERPSGDFRVVSPRYFETMGIRLVRGRVFTEGDRAESAPAIVIDEALARAAFGDADAIGRRIRLGLGGEREMPREVVGVVADVRQRALDVPARPGYYLPITQVQWSTMRVVVRAGGDPRALRAALEREVAALDPLIPVRNVATVKELVGASVVAPRFNTLLLGTFASLALLLAAAGIYSVMSYAVTQRTHEIGVRMALGAAAGTMQWSVARGALRLALVGTAIGLAIALAATPRMDTLLFGVSARDPVAFAVPPLVFLLVAWLGSYLPARRASRVDPVVALRAD